MSRQPAFISAGQCPWRVFWHTHTHNHRKSPGLAPGDTINIHINTAAPVYEQWIWLWKQQQTNIFWAQSCLTSLMLEAQTRFSSVCCRERRSSDFTSENKIVFTVTISPRWFKSFSLQKRLNASTSHWSKSIVGTCATPDTQISVFCRLLSAKSWSQTCPDTRLLRNSHEAFFCLWCHFHFLNKSGTESKGQTPFLYFFC